MKTDDRIALVAVGVWLAAFAVYASFVAFVLWLLYQLVMWVIA